MGRKPPMPELNETGRRYVEDTARVRLASPGIERFRRSPRRSARRLLLAALVLAALAAALLVAGRGVLGG
jgi:hypothetical protein